MFVSDIEWYCVSSILENLLLGNAWCTFWKPKNNSTSILRKESDTDFVGKQYLAQKDVEAVLFTFTTYIFSKDLLLWDSKHSKRNKHFTKWLKANSIVNIQFPISLGLIVLIHLTHLNHLLAFLTQLWVFFPSLPVSSLIPKFLLHFLVVGSRETKVKCESGSIKSKLSCCPLYIK